MKIAFFVGPMALIAIVCVTGAAAQQAILISDATAEPAKVDMPVAHRAIFDREVLPAARTIFANDACEETIEFAGSGEGSFTKPSAAQTFYFYQFCHTGNGMGSVGVVIFENGRIVGNFASAENGAAIGARALPDIDQNGLDEIAVHLSGGMHQGAGGTGVDVFQVSKGSLSPVGWFQSDSFSDTSPVIGYKVFAKPGRPPVFTREKHQQNSAGRWRRVGSALPFKLQTIDRKFEAVK